MTDIQLPSDRNNAAHEPPILADEYTPMTKEEWECNMAIVDKVLSEVGIREQKSLLPDRLISPLQ